MTHIGLWLELDVTIAFMVGLGLGSLLGQRTIATILMIVLDLLITPAFTSEPLPYVLNGQRLLVGAAMEQLRPTAMAVTGGLLGRGGGGEHGLPPMPTWATDRGHRRLDRRLDRAGRLAHGQPRRLTRVTDWPRLCATWYCVPHGSGRRG